MKYDDDFHISKKEIILTILYAIILTILWHISLQV